MKKYTILFFLMAVGLSAEVDGQEQTKRVIPKNVNFFNRYIPIRDTVIMHGEDIEVGAYFARKDKDKYEEVIEVENFGHSKKSDVDQGYFVVKLKPKQTTRYNIKAIKCDFVSNLGRWKDNRDRRIVYVAKTEEERKKLEEELNQKRLLQKARRKQGFGSLDNPDVR